ncbi:CMRF35-like molecule 5 isoform X2 [Molossus molossus]|uniref:CMRF35-like molecule 5 isoform X2 n=1 Tax=Molossus molossus TaxID=27622 RepID=UPI001747BD05|nr:CMRF35-like molecule 5 isoform X2 [Molossus molossus]
MVTGTEPGSRTMWLLLPLLLLVVPVSSADITGPEEAKGLEQGWLEVQCRYAPGWETYKKWWCRGADLGSCKILVKTNGSEQEAKENRVSIRDDQTSRTFTVTMKALRREDTGVYWCGIERPGVDPRSRVNVIIGPVPVTMGNPAGSPTATSPPSDGRSLLSSVHFLLLVFLKVPLLLGMLSAVVWVNRPLRSSGRRPSQPHDSPKAPCSLKSCLRRRTTHGRTRNIYYEVTGSAEMWFQKPCWSRLTQDPNPWEPPAGRPGPPSFLRPEATAQQGSRTEMQGKAFPLGLSLEAFLISSPWDTCRGHGPISACPGAQGSRPS